MIPGRVTHTLGSVGIKTHLYVISVWHDKYDQRGSIFQKRIVFKCLSYYGTLL